MVNVNMHVFSKFTNSLKFKSLIFGGLKTFTTSCRLGVKVAVFGAAGGVGNPLSLLLKMSPLVTELALYDTKNCDGLGVDLSHINTHVKVSYFSKTSLLQEAIEKKDIIISVAGKPRTKEQTRGDLFNENVNLIREVTDAMVKVAPCAMLCIVTNPVNSLVPVAAGILNKANIFDPRKLFGITTVDSVRSSTFAGEIMCYDPSKLVIPVIGGHSTKTIVPVFSQSSLPINLPKDRMKALVERVQMAGHEVVVARGGSSGSSTVCTAYAVARFIFSLCRAIRGEKQIVECSYVKSDLTDACFFSTPLLLGPMGVKKNLGYGKLTPEECCLLSVAVKELVAEIEVGKKYLDNSDKKK